MSEPRDRESRGTGLRWLLWIESGGAQRLIWVLFLVITLVGGAVCVKRAIWSSSEFRGFQDISLDVLFRGQDPYTDLGHVRAYPPFFSIAFLPFAMFGSSEWGVGVGAALFYLTGIVLYTWSVRLALAAGWGKGGQIPFRFVVAIWCAMAPLFFAVSLRCESDALVLFPLCLGAYLIWREERPFLGGIAIAFAASFKVLPGLFGVFLLCRRRWKALGGMIAGGILFTILIPTAVWGPSRAWALHYSWLENVVIPYHYEGAGPVIGRPFRSANQSLTAVVHRYLTPINAGSSTQPFRINIFNCDEETADTVAKALRFLVAAGLVVLWWVARSDTALGNFLLYATVPPGIMVLSEVALTTHHVLLLLPVAALAASCWSPEAKPRYSAAGWFLLAGVFLTWLAAIPLLKARGAVCYGNLVLLGATAYYAWQSGSKRNELPSGV